MFGLREWHTQIPSNQTLQFPHRQEQKMTMSMDQVESLGDEVYGLDIAS